MRTLQFIIEGQKLSKNGDFSKIIRGTKGYLLCKFEFKGNDWLGCKAVAVFEAPNIETASPIKSDGSCMIPDEVSNIPIFKVKVIGVRNENYRIITNRILISQEG